MFKKILPWLLCAVFVLGLSACKKRQTRADEAAAQGVLLIANGSEPSRLDPHLATGVPENRIISSLLEGLIAYHPTNDSLPEPGMAESWEPNEDSSEWTFHIRDARWSNGDPVTAQDFVYSWRRMLTAALGAEYAPNLFVIKNAQEYFEQKITDFEQVGVHAIDEKTLRVTLVGPAPYFLNMLKHYSFFPVNPCSVESMGGITDRMGEWTRPGNFVCNGPFVLEQWETNKVIRVVKNPDYWDADKVQLNAIEFIPIENQSTEESSFLAGQLHLTTNIPLSKIPYYLSNRGDIAHFEPYLGVYFYRLNVTKPPLDNPKVRMALNYVINRKLITENVTRASEQPTYAYTPPGIMGYEPPVVLSTDADKARQLLAEAGYPGGEGFPPLEILINTDEGHRQLAEVMQQIWSKELGIHVTILNQEWKVFLESQNKMDYDISRSGWIGDYMDPGTFLDMWTTGNGNNQTGWSNSDYDRIILEARMARNQQARYEKLFEAEQILLKELPIVPVYWYTTKHLMDPRLRGYYPKLLDNHPYKYMYFDLDTQQP
ncbi:MAG: peptide ABC transporter substrate-binding protein [Opitutales bacterium]|nr:peptide ABC transporter substrate-binding protein [Opitutales bacterium]